jgi:hypothetical protein
MVADAEWVAGIKLTDPQREAVVKAFKWAPEDLKHVRAIELDNSLLALAHACQRAIGLTQRPPLDQFLAQKDEILAGEGFPDENRYYTD